jgi:hypothetical protein
MRFTPGPTAEADTWKTNLKAAYFQFSFLLQRPTCLVGLERGVGKKLKLYGFEVLNLKNMYNLLVRSPSYLPPRENSILVASSNIWIFIPTNLYRVGQIC